MNRISLADIATGIYPPQQEVKTLIFSSNYLICEENNFVNLKFHLDQVKQSENPWRSRNQSLSYDAIKSHLHSTGYWSTLNLKYNNDTLKVNL